MNGQHVEMSVCDVQQENAVKKEPQEEERKIGSLTGGKRERSRVPLGGTTPTQQAYRVHTRGLVAQLDKVLPRNPLTAELVGEKPKRGAKGGRPRNVVLGDLVDLVQKIRMDEVALELAEEFRKRPRMAAPPRYLPPSSGMHMPYPVHGAPVPEMRPHQPVHYDPVHYDTSQHHHYPVAPPTATAPVAAAVPPPHYSEVDAHFVQSASHVDMSHAELNHHLGHDVTHQLDNHLDHHLDHLDQQFSSETSFVTSLPPAPSHTTIDGSSILGGGHQDAEILAWLHEGSNGSKGTLPEKTMDHHAARAPNEDDFPSFQDVPPCFWNERSGPRPGTDPQNTQAGCLSAAASLVMASVPASAARMTALPTDPALSNTSLQSLQSP